MKKALILLAFIVGLGAYAVSAQPQNNDAERLKLATRLHEIKPVKPLIDSAIEGMSLGVPEDKREKFANAMMLATDYDAVEKASIESMAKSFTIGELKAMLAYYGSDAAKSAEAKMPDYLKDVSVSIQKALDQGVLDAALKPQNNPQKTAPKTP